MKKTRFTEEQMVEAVKQLEAGRLAKDLARELGISDQTLDNWRAKYSGLDVNEARRTDHAGTAEATVRVSATGGTADQA